MANMYKVLPNILHLKRRCIELNFDSLCEPKFIPWLNKKKSYSKKPKFSLNWLTLH